MAKPSAVIRGLARVARRLALAAAAAAVLMALALYDEGWLVALAVVAAVPAAILLLFSVAVGELAELPGRLRGAPAQAAELRASVEEVARARGSRLPRALWRAGRQALAVRETATPWAPLLPLASLPFLAATAVSAIVVPVLLVAALVVLIVYA